MKNLRNLCCLLFLSLELGCSQNGYKLESLAIYLADPTIFYHNDTYYLYGTTGDPKFKDQEGFLVYTSKDLKNWEGPKGVSDGLALKKGDAFGDTGFWAPQIFEYEQKFYMAYTANEKIAMATADSPLGPFKNALKEDLKASVRQIDPFVFFDDDGKKYLYHVRLTDGNRIFVAELENDLMAIKPETLTECLSSELPWENTQNEDWPVTEGPTVLKHQGLYYLIYSANDFRNPNYAVGFATSESPLGPWKKSEKSPIIRREILGIHGTGHGDVFLDKEGQMQYVLHTHLSNTEVNPRRTAIVKIDFSKDENNTDGIVIDKNTFMFLE
jgi:beta-xylosidase